MPKISTPALLFGFTLCSCWTTNDKLFKLFCLLINMYSSLMSFDVIKVGSMVYFCLTLQGERALTLSDTYCCTLCSNAICMIERQIKQELLSSPNRTTYKKHTITYKHIYIYKSQNKKAPTQDVFYSYSVERLESISELLLHFVLFAILIFISSIHQTCGAYITKIKIDWAQKSPNITKIRFD